jgi:O-6-methylguanine DNA methyltransferase
MTVERTPGPGSSGLRPRRRSGGPGKGVRGRFSGETHAVSIRTSDGTFIAEFSANGLCALAFPGQPRRPGARRPRTPPPERIRAWVATTVSALGALLAGEAPGAWPVLDLSTGTPFQEEVWDALRRIPRGETRTYGEIAADLGRPQAARAVGRACGANPVPVFVPCHRVQAAGGRLGGFSGGLRWKRLLLAREIK